MDHEEPLAHLFHQFLLPFWVGLQLVDQSMVAIERVLEVGLNELHVAGGTSSVLLALAKKLELVLLASMPR